MFEMQSDAAMVNRDAPMKSADAGCGGRVRSTVNAVCMMWHGHPVVV